MDDTGDFRRVSPTTRLNCKALEIPPGVDGVGGLLTNIAGGGICFCHDERFEPGTRLAMEMEVAGLPANVLALGTVVWCQANGTPTTHEIGAELHWVGWGEQAAQEAIANRLAAALDDAQAADMSEEAAARSAA